MMELYWAYVDYNAIMELVENMIPALAEEVTGSTQIVVGDNAIDLLPPWPRRTIDSMLQELLGTTLVEMRADPQVARATLAGRGVEVEKRDSFSMLVDKALKHIVWPTLIQPTFAIDYPIELSPLAKCSAEDELIVERFQAVIAGKEVGNAFSELNDHRISAAASRSRQRTKRPETKKLTCWTRIFSGLWNTECPRPAASVSVSTAWP